MSLTLRQQTRLYDVIRDIEGLKYSPSKNVQERVAPYLGVVDGLIKKIRLTIENEDGFTAWNVIKQYNENGVIEVLDYLGGV